ncbi:hypothetical protein [Klenkia terrae]|uniref:Uncharacterized protein n=1 Tax=Klenkia terrae TaxID=1052259 RepID=A0ABU8EA70_9ACTN|nr:hypothetical protein [Klenkia terrae]SSC25762.1 Hypothetical protein KLENKIAIHU_4387 [Klenkia terrae]
MTAADQAPATAVEVALSQLVNDAHRRRSSMHEVTSGRRRRLALDRHTGRDQAVPGCRRGGQDPLTRS